MTQKHRPGIRDYFLLVCGSMVLCFLSCSVGSVRSSVLPSSVDIASDTTFKLLEPRELGKSLTAVQTVEALHKDETYSFTAQMEVDSTKIVIVGFTPFGSRAFALILQGGSLRFERHHVRKLPFDPVRMLADIQLVYWPLDVVAARLAANGTTVEESGSDKRVRSIHRNGQTLIRIEYSQRNPWEGVVVFHHLERGYRLRVDTQEYELIR